MSGVGLPICFRYISISFPCCRVRWMLLLSLMCGLQTTRRYQGGRTSHDSCYPLWGAVRVDHTRHPGTGLGFGVWVSMVCVRINAVLEVSGEKRGQLQGVQVTFLGGNRLFIPRPNKWDLKKSGRVRCVCTISAPSIRLVWNYCPRVTLWQTRADPFSFSAPHGDPSPNSCGDTN